MNIDPDALGQNDGPEEEDIYTGMPWNHHSRFDGMPGMVWFSKVRKVKGADLRIGDALDSLDHRGARTIYGIDAPAPDSPVRTVVFGFGDTETVHVDVEYDVVDMDSQVTPDGTPVVVPDYPDC